jgi:hypothetical protein
MRGLDGGKPGTMNREAINTGTEWPAVRQAPGVPASF